MLRGIDISSWQEGINLRDVIMSNGLDFVVIKATEGTGYVEDTCDYWVQTCISNGTLFGFYHFAFGGSNTPEDEASFFYEACTGYIGHGVPVLDIEKNTIPDWGNWCQRFVDRFHALSGVYPLIYCSSSQLYKFAGTQLPQTCGLWVAQYPYYAHGFDAIDYEDGSCPWAFVAVWQFTSQGRLEGYGYDLDLDYAYMDKEAWHKYADPEGATAKPSDTGPIPVPVPADVHVFEDASMRVEVTLK